jgi:serine/threonine protein kinase
MEETGPGTRVDDFTIAYRIARGMNSDVFAVWHHVLRTPLVCKRLRGADSGDAKWRRLLREEGRALSLMHHPGIVRLFGQNHDSEQPYLLLEHVGDRTLRDVLREEGPLEAGHAVRVVQHVAAAIAHAHERGFIHRDLKPSNVVIRAGRPVLLDFGVAWKIRSTRRPPDRSGTPQYLSPEQILRAPLTKGTDVFGLGALLFELLTDERPFRRGDERSREIAARYPQLGEEPKRLSELARDTPDALARVVHRCLEKDPRLRLASAADLAAALDEFTPIKIWPGKLSNSRINPFTWWGG